MARKKGEGRITTSVTISPQFYELSKKYNISFTEALRVGLSIIFAEMGEQDYDNKLNIYRKMQYFKSELEKVSNEFEIFKKKTNDSIINITEKEVEEEFKKIGI